MCHVSCVGLKCKNICISKYEIWRINMHNQDVNYLLIHEDQANDYITAINGYRLPMEYKKQELSSCVFTMCLHNIFLIWLSINMIVHWYLLEFRISYFWYLFFLCCCCHLAEFREVVDPQKKHRIISQPFKRMVELWIWNALQLRNIESLEKHVVNLFLDIFWIPFSNLSQFP